ncbi:hypothetical protein [Nocardioides jiangxiensis]|uniref:Uncharacterized protein n=1 Tax=Nocardioides jiangxiensis TaxID=3064524 RepID=A0ABT9AWU2_9ACTN|nr:hypothetical protein [Nocardioides sp. WY-20]MDO7866952.1 hypothetical protein [Nocardioides sp. WY-20]
MHWTYWLAGAIALAFVASILVFAALRDRRRGKEVVGDLPERTDPTEHPTTEHGSGPRG